MNIRALLGLSFIVVTSLFGGCITNPNEDIRKKANTDEKFVTEIAWDTTKRDMGVIEEGQQLEVIYAFTNKGKKPLVFKTAQASCGCTVPELPKEPIMPGKSGVLKAVFNSAGRVGANHKTVTVYSNTNPKSFVLEFDVTVNPKPEAKPAQNPS